MPIGTSMSPLFLIFPASAKTFVPGLSSVPYFLYSEAPFKIIHAIFAKVSTLLILVGLPHNPDCAGNGGRMRGIPRSPSIDAISAVSSPQTNAPAPSFMCNLNLKFVPKILSPKKPFASASAIAFLRWRIASGYSARQ